MKRYIVFALFIMGGCASQPGYDDINNKAMLINVGMAKSEVLSIMGPPAKRSFKKSQEALDFCGLSAFKGTQVYTIWFTNQKVSAVTNYSDSMDLGDCRRHIKEIDWGQVPADISIEVR